MATSRISAVRQAIAATMSGSGWEVRAHNPGDSAGSRSVVYLGEASSSQEHLTLDGGRLETIGFQGAVRTVSDGAGDAEAIAAEDAALAIVADLETAFRANPLLGGAFQVEFTGPLESEVLAAEQQRIAVVTFVVVARVAI